MAAIADSGTDTEPRYAWVIVWASFTALAVIFGVSYSFAAFFEPLRSQFQAQRADISLMFGLSGLIYFLLGAAAGVLSDRYGPRLVTSAGMGCIAAGLLAASWAPSLAVVIAVYGIGVGVGVGLVYAPAIACVQPWFTRRRGLAAGIASAGIGAGTLLVPLGVAWAIDSLQWRGALRALALGVLLLGLGATALLKAAPLAAGSARGAAPGMTLREALGSRPFFWLYVTCLVAAPSMFIPFAHVSAAARDIGIDEVRAVGLVGLIGIGSLSGRFAIGALADRIGRPLTLVLMQVSLGLSYLLWGAAGGYTAMAGFALWMGISYGGLVSLLPALCMDFFGARAVASIIGTLYTGAALGNLGGPFIAGWVFDRFGSYSPVIVGCGALSALAAYASARAVRRERAVSASPGASAS